MTDNVRKKVEATLDSAGDATAWISATHEGKAGQEFPRLDISIACSSDWVGTIKLQKTIDSGVTAHDVEEWTEDAQDYLEDSIVGVLFRLYCSARSAGEADVMLYK